MTPGFTNQFSEMKVTILAAMAGLFLLGCRSTEKVPTSVGEVDLKKYTGLWYDVASFPVRFQRGCHCTTAEYTLMPEGYVKVVNKCRKGGYNIEETGISGKAFPVKGTGNTKLKVQFFWPFRADYWIVRLDKDYRWAVVSSPAKDYLWILSRTPRMNENIYQNIINDLLADGYDTSRLVKVPQECK